MLRRRRAVRPVSMVPPRLGVIFGFIRVLERESIIKEDSREVVEVIAKEIDDEKTKETAAEK